MDLPMPYLHLDTSWWLFSSIDQLLAPNHSSSSNVVFVMAVQIQIGTPFLPLTQEAREKDWLVTTDFEYTNPTYIKYVLQL
jgi:hypothetical protein